MNLSADCMLCLATRQAEQLDPSLEEGTKAEYLRAVLRAIAEASPGESAPVVLERISMLRNVMIGEPTGLDALKREYNEMMLRREPELAQKISSAPDPLHAALQLARAGNYIDFGAMGQIENEKLDRLLNRAGSEKLDPAVYEAFTQDLRQARNLVYLTDNCGEIVLDKLLIQTMQKLFPRLSVTAVVRGRPVLNDATMEDAIAVRLPDVAPVIGNGTGIAGTHLPVITGEARQAILAADVVVSKGQGNFETMQGCGLNVYYLFLCKCRWFTRRFGLALHEGVFIRERDCAL